MMLHTHPSTKTALGLVCAWLLLGLTSACRSSRCPSQGQVELELRDRAGNLLLLGRKPQSELLLCDSDGRRVGAISERDGALWLSDASKSSGQAVSRVREDAQDHETVLERGSERYRLHEASGLLRLLDPAGVPLAQIARPDDQGRALAYDAGGTPLGYAEKSGDRLVIHGRDGAVQHYLVARGSAYAAAVLIIDKDKLSQNERLLLFRHLAKR